MYQIEYEFSGEPHTERAGDWDEVKFRVPFIRDVCGCPVKVYRLSRNQKILVKAPRPPRSQS